MSFTNALFIINKFSGGGYRPEVEGRIIEQCKALDIESTIAFTQSRGHAIELAHLAAEQKFDLVFAVGGDGTVNEVAQGLVNTGVTMGILPKGSGNGLARHLGIPMSFRRALGVLRKNQVRAIDTLSVNGKLSVNVSGIGFDGYIAGLFANKAKRGLAGYAKLVLKEFITFQPFDAEVTVNGEVLKAKPFLIAVANSSQFGNNARVAPRASVSDQLMDLCLIKKVPLAQAPGFAGKMFTGQLAHSRFVEMRQTDRLTIELDKPMAYHIDGEAMSAASSFDVLVQPASLNMLLPGQIKKAS